MISIAISVLVFSDWLSKLSNSSLIWLSIGNWGFQEVPPILTGVILNLPKFWSKTNLSQVSLCKWHNALKS